MAAAARNTHAIPAVSIHVIEGASFLFPFSLILPAWTPL